MYNKKLGRIHSFESFGTHEGPGIRYVIFLQGCLARCIYCQNPDTWNLHKGKLIAPKEVFEKIERTLPYIRSSNGGVTVSGGEPLLQMDFLIALFKLCRKNSIHTAIDTSCFYSKITFPHFRSGENPTSEVGKGLDVIINLTGLFIVDIKASEEKLHKKITSRELIEAFSFIDILEKKKKPYWLRYVLIPTLNDSEKDINALRKIISPLKHCERFEFLPYHTLGKYKWKHLGLKYPLKNLPVATKENIDKAKALLGSCPKPEGLTNLKYMI